MIHGLTGTSHDLQPLASTLREAGFPVFLVQLPGHGTTASDLARRSWQEWHEAARQGIAELEAAADRVAVIGLSLGSLLALHLAYSLPDRVACVVALSTALHLRSPWLRRASPALAALARAESWLPGLRAALAKVILPKGSPDIEAQQARKESPSYHEIPLRALMQLSVLQRLVIAELPFISQPTLVVHGAKDRTCPLSNADLLASRLGSSCIRKVVLERSAHVVTLDVEQDKFAEVVLRFLAEVCESKTGCWSEGARRSAPPVNQPKHSG